MTSSLDVAQAVHDVYPLGRSDAETERLALQHQVYAPITRQFLVAAGVTRGMRVLDVGSGAGDVALLLAELVGPEGAVVGVDANGDILERARARVAAAGVTNVDLRCGELGQVELDGPFDAVVGRWILMYIPRPAELVRRLAGLVRPGGTLAFLESEDLRRGPRTHPTTPLHEQVRRWMAFPEDAPGPAADMGLRLHRTFLDAGLPGPQLRRESPIGGGPDWPGYRLVAESVRSLLPYLEVVGGVTAADVDVDTLERRLRDDVLAAGAVQVLPTVIGAWSRRP